VAPASSPAMPSVEPAAVKLSLSTPEKITLFRSLFRGREDVYAQRWESQDGRTGYSPRTDRDWLTTLPNRRLSAATDGNYFHDVWRDLYDRRCTHQRNRKGFCRARLIDVTPEKEIVFDMWIDGSGENPALSLSSFRAEFVGESK